MATIQADTVITITVDRATLDVLRTCLRSEAYELEDFAGVISGPDQEAAHAALAHAAHLVEMFDQLGWEDRGPRDRYEITVALDSFVPRLRRYKGDLAESLADEMMFLRRIAEGDEPHDWGGRTQQEMIAITREEVLGWRTELEAVEALLERLGAGGEGTVRTWRRRKPDLSPLRCPSPTTPPQVPNRQPFPANAPHR